MCLLAFLHLPGAFSRWSKTESIESVVILCREEFIH